MISYVEEIKSKYKEDISSYLPIQRAGVYLLVLYFLAFYFQKCPEANVGLQPLDGFWLHLLNMDVMYFVGTTDGLIATMKIKYHAIAIGVVFTLAIVNSYLKNGMYDFYVLIHSDFQKFIDECKENALGSKSPSSVVNIELSRDLSPQLAKSERIISRYAAINEFFVGLAAASIANTFFKFELQSCNSVILFLSIITILFINFTSIKYYFEEYLPIYTFIKALRGETLE